jgi:membrane protease YdiL (CAAX protease family)
MADVLAVAVERRPERVDVWHPEVRQYSLVEVVTVWADAAIPMALLAWVVAPWLGGGEPLEQALLILLTMGLIWQGVLVLILTRRDLGSLQWARVRQALWLQAPRDPRTRRVGGRAWWWVLPFIVLFALKQTLPKLTGPLPRDFGALMASDRGQTFFHSAWGWFAVAVVLAVFNTMLGEELLFRGLLLPRMCGAFGRWGWVANGVLFAVYHLHQPWSIPTNLLDTFALAYPARRFRSAWFGVIVHSTRASSSSPSYWRPCSARA